MSDLRMDAVKADYLGRVHNSLLATGRTANRALLGSFVLNVVVLAVLAGSLSVSQEFTLWGARFLPSAGILLGGAQVISLYLFAQSWAVMLAERTLLQIVRRLYHELGLRDTTLSDPDESYVIAPGVGMILSERFAQVRRLGRVAHPIVQTGLALLVFLLPLTAQVRITFVAWSMYDSTVVRLLFCACPLLTMCYLDVVEKHIKRFDDEVFRPDALHP